MIITRGFGSRLLMTRGYGTTVIILREVVRGMSFFTKQILGLSKI